jgi:hypothetical protein
MDTLFTKEPRQLVVKQLILLLLLLSQFSFAEPVHRWQDQQGHWHYGDGAASNTFHGKTVAINTPISIVKNEHAQQHIDVEKATISRAPRLKTIHHKKTSLSDQHKIYCNDMRDKIHRTELSMDDMAQRQILLNTYEQQCIHGH